MKRLLIVGSFAGTAMFATAVFLGLFIAFKIPSVANWAVSAIGAITIVALMLSTHDIMRKTDSVYRTMRLFWIAAFFLGGYALYLAACRHLILGQAILDNPGIDYALVKAADTSQKLVMWVLILLTAAAPIAISYLLNPLRSEDYYYGNPRGAQQGRR